MKLKDYIDAHYGGKLCQGAGDGETTACLLTAVNHMRGSTGDDPQEAGIFDVRALNDAFASDELRTKWMLKIYNAYKGCPNWPKSRKRAVVTKIAILTVNRLIAALPGLSSEIRQQCANATTLDDGAGAARAARAMAARAMAARATADAAQATAYAAEWAADADAAAYAAAAAEKAAAADAAAYAAAEKAAARDKVAVKACQLWIEAAKEA